MLNTGKKLNSQQDVIKLLYSFSSLFSLTNNFVFTNAQFANVYEPNKTIINISYIFNIYFLC